MVNTTDMELLRSYDRQGSEEAFAELVRRHLSLVYSAALRRVGIAAEAEEITQAVFVILAHKAGQLRPDTILEGWLYETTRLTALSFRRGEWRRQTREQEAYMQSTLDDSTDTSVWHQLAPLLEEGMARLGKTDRDAVILRYFKEKNLREVAEALRVNEAAAQRRVHRAVEKLRKFFTRRGVVSTTALIAGAISAHSVQAAPAGLAKSVTAAAIAKGASVSSSTLTLIKGALKIMAWTKAKVAVVVAAGVLLAAGTTTVTIKEIQAHKTYPWQVEFADSRVLEKQPPQVVIAPRRLPNGGGWVGDGRKSMGLGVSAKDIVQRAYGQSEARTAFLSELPNGKYDYIASFPSGNEAALQKEIQKQFGVTGRHENRETDVLLLKIQKPNAPGLKPTDPSRRGTSDGSSSYRSLPGYYSMRNQSSSALV